MSSDVNPSPSTPALRVKEPIPGYELLERIGAGGYGEVWRATAPGGLFKAVKLVYSRQGDERARRELKALNRIKEVRHPFLLSLERIEVVDGLLVIVAELAEGGSLRDLFDECQSAGMAGIPRDRLFGYLGDAADALDFLCTEHNLQHLDIKPENLLLVGGRVKVADFGLVKELFDATSSMMGGLTPVYAPPEVFDGRADPRSDQYSLAIVFQEMLTGELPFAGRTAAQLAAQHLHSRPRLESLPPADRAVIAKALSKDPAKRFGSCRELIDQLLHAGNRPQASRSTNLPSARVRKKPDADKSDSKTIAIDALPAAGMNEEAPRANCEKTSLPPLEFEASSFRYRPTVFIGVGGTASLIMRNIKRRMADRFGDLEQLPAFRFLQFDTDRKALADAADTTDRGALSADEILALSLRPTREYRQNADKFLSLISRRWIYNIPRSLDTEGLRPLGRLALADHATRVKESLQAALVSACNADGITKSSEKTGLKFEGGPPRVFVLGSISGGTGSGMVLDLAYAVRQTLAELNLSDEDVYGILMHSTDRRAQSRDLAVSNAVACLAELSHYSQPASHYPGDALFGVPTFNGATFPHTYLVHLGNDLNQQDFCVATEEVAEYVLQNAVTEAGEFFDSCRQATEEIDRETVSDPKVRAFGICRVGCSSGETSRAVSDRVCRKLLEEWLGELKSTNSKPLKFSEQNAPLPHSGKEEFLIDASIDQIAAEQSQLFELDLQHLVNASLRACLEELGKDPGEFYQTLLHQFHKNYRGADNRNTRVTGLLKTIDTVFGTSKQDETDYVSLLRAMDARVADLAEQRGVAICDWVRHLIDDSRARLKSGKRAINWFVQCLAGVVDQSRERLDELSRELLQIKNQLLQGGEAAADTDEGDETDALIESYYQVQLEKVAVSCAGLMARRISEVSLANLADHLRDLTREIRQVADGFSANKADESSEASNGQSEPAAAAEPRSQSDFAREIQEAAKQAISRRIPEFVAELENQLKSESAGLYHLMSDLESAGDLTHRLRDAARSIVARALQQVNVSEIILPPDDQHALEGTRLKQCLDAAAAPWVTCAGAKRLLAIIPNQDDVAVFEQKFEELVKQPVNLSADPSGDLIFCNEVEDITLSEVIAELLDGRPDLAQVAERLHTRCDVEWLTL